MDIKVKASYVDECIEFKTQYVGDDDIDSLSCVRKGSIVEVYIDQSEEDEEGIGPYYVWLALSSGHKTACFAGTLDECKEHYEIVKRELFNVE